MTAPANESHSLRSPIDRRSLRQFSDAFEQVEPLASGTLDDPLDPRKLSIRLDDGIGPSAGGRFDVRWSTQGDYNIHYTDDRGSDMRWDVHQHDYPAPNDDAHFHPPPAASNKAQDVEGSCIRVRRVFLVAMATATIWREAYQNGTLDLVNQLSNPP